jgi:hypothetical protein
MRVVYEAENIIDAHLVKGLLERDGVPAFVSGEYLTGALGELPVMGLVSVSVPDSEFPQAQLTLAALRRERARPIADPAWDAEPDPA